MKKPTVRNITVCGQTKHYSTLERSHLSHLVNVIYHVIPHSLSQCAVSDHQLATVNNLSLLISVRGCDHSLFGFTSYEITELIDELAVM